MGRWTRHPALERGAIREGAGNYLVAATVISDLEGSNATRVSSLFSIPSTRASTRATCTAKAVIPSFALRKSDDISLAYQPIMPRQIAITEHSVCQSLSLPSRDMAYGYDIPRELSTEYRAKQTRYATTYNTFAVLSNSPTNRSDMDSNLLSA